jgi:hypothetical protein
MAMHSQLVLRAYPFTEFIQVPTQDPRTVSMLHLVFSVPVEENEPANTLF